MNKRREKSKYFFKNKKADISVTILVLGVLALIIFGLLSFYLVGEKVKGGGVISYLHLQGVYTDAESARFSDENLAYKYFVKKEEGKFVIQMSAIGEIGGFQGIGSESREILKIKYAFDK